MAGINDYLDETKKNLDILVSEIERYKSNREMNEKLLKSLETISSALDITQQKITPFKNLEVQKYLLIFLGISAGNTLLLITVLILTVLK